MITGDLKGCAKLLMRLGNAGGAATCETAAARIERLEAALRRIAEWPDADTETMGMRARAMEAIARQALGDAPAAPAPEPCPACKKRTEEEARREALVASIMEVVNNPPPVTQAMRDAYAFYRTAVTAPAPEVTDKMVAEMARALRPGASEANIAAFVDGHIFWPFGLGDLRRLAAWAINKGARI